MLRKTHAIILGCIFSLFTASSRSATLSAASQDHGVVKSTCFPIQDMSILSTTCFDESAYVNVKQEDDNLCFYFDYDKAHKDGVFKLKVSAGITIASLTTMLAGLAGIFTLKTEKSRNLCLISATIGAFGALCGGTSTFLCAMTNSAQVPTDKPFRIISKSGIWDKNAGEITWADINTVEIHQQEGVLLGYLIITLLHKDSDGKNAKYLLHGTLGGLVVLANFILKCKEVFGSNSGSIQA